MFNQLDWAEKYAGFGGCALQLSCKSLKPMITHDALVCVRDECMYVRVRTAFELQ